MAYTVSMPGGAEEYELEVLEFRLLMRRGISVACCPRVVDPATGKRWLYAWDKKSDARKAAAELRQETQNDKWEVYQVPDSELSRGPLGPIDILVARRSDGCTYSVSPLTFNLIRKSYPEARVVPSVFIAKSSDSDFETEQGPYWDHVAFILTGLSEQQIKHLGGYQIIDWRRKEVFHEQPLLAGEWVIISCSTEEAATAGKRPESSEG
jgi:hypothetical protein